MSHLSRRQQLSADEFFEQRLQPDSDTGVMRVRPLKWSDEGTNHKQAALPPVVQCERCHKIIFQTKDGRAIQHHQAIRPENETGSPRGMDRSCPFVSCPYCLKIVPRTQLDHHIHVECVEVGVASDFPGTARPGRPKPQWRMSPDSQARSHSNDVGFTQTWRFPGQ